GYAVARIAVSAVEDKQLTNRYATAEARRAGEDLASEDDAVLLRVARALGLAAEPRGREFALPFTDYLRATSDISALDWKLVNQKLDRGWVVLPKKRLARTCQEALKLRLLTELPLPVPADVAKMLAPWPEELRSRLSEMRARSVELAAAQVTPEAFPPCIRALIASIQASENVSHEGRFATVAFLHTIGMERDAIVQDLFSSVPDFAREITEYQVDHITGRKAHEAYTPPGCQAMQTFGLCPMMTKQKAEWDRLCAQEWMKHPLTYYRKTLQRMGKLVPARTPGSAPE
ncbi:MAG: DNA primase large subunit PriL, partial [Myxococcota bacterium]